MNTVMLELFIDVMTYGAAVVPLLFIVTAIGDYLKERGEVK